jgi:psiF repeat
MARLIWLATFSATVVFSTALIARPAVAENSQQARMTACNADAKTKGLAGDDRKAFMKTCLSAKPGADTQPVNSQQARMKSCNADASAKNLKGADRKAFMSNCLKATSTS